MNNIPCERDGKSGDDGEELNPEEQNSQNGTGVDNEWPKNWSIQIKNLSLRYHQHLPLVLRNVNLDINAGEKVAIVGSTGSGKSSLVQALFRIV